MTSKWKVVPSVKPTRRTAFPTPSRVSFVPPLSFNFQLRLVHRLQHDHLQSVVEWRCSLDDLTDTLEKYQMDDESARLLLEDESYGYQRPNSPGLGPSRNYLVKVRRTRRPFLVGVVAITSIIILVIFSASAFYSDYWKHWTMPRPVGYPSDRPLRLLIDPRQTMNRKRSMIPHPARIPNSIRSTSCLLTTVPAPHLYPLLHRHPSIFPIFWSINPFLDTQPIVRPQPTPQSWQPLPLPTSHSFRFSQSKDRVSARHIAVAHMDQSDPPCPPRSIGSDARRLDEVPRPTIPLGAPTETSRLKRRCMPLLPELEGFEW